MVCEGNWEEVAGGGPEPTRARVELSRIEYADTVGRGKYS